MLSVPVLPGFKPMAIIPESMAMKMTYYIIMLYHHFLIPV